MNKIWIYTSTLPYVFKAQCLIKHRTGITLNHLRKELNYKLLYQQLSILTTLLLITVAVRSEALNVFALSNNGIVGRPVD
jgi:hypothetical protein